MTHQKVSGLVQHQHALLFYALDRDQTHGWSCHRLADRFPIPRIGLARLDISFHLGWRHQPHRMTELAQFPAPMVSCCTGLNTDQSGAKAREEFQHFTPAQRPSNDSPAVGVNAVHLENLLGKIKSNRRNLVHGAVPFDVCRNNHLGTSDAVWGPLHPLKLSTNSQIKHKPKSLISVGLKSYN